MDAILSHFDAEILASQRLTSRGVLFVPNDDILQGPKYLIRLHQPLRDAEIPWELIDQFFLDGDRKTCREFYRLCNGFSFSWRFNVPGILTEVQPDGDALSTLNVPYDIGTISYRSFPKFSPEEGFLLSKTRLGNEPREICDVINSAGKIVFGEFRKSAEVHGVFNNLTEWLETRVAQALLEMKADGVIR